MTTLTKLDVSLTKHGAHKVSFLLGKYHKDEVLKKLSGVEAGINIELAQAKKTLSADSRGVVPDLWARAQQRGSETINALVLIAIIFSHHSLIFVMSTASRKRPFAGRLRRGKGIDGKAYTNFAHILEELGYSTEHTADHVDYDLHKLFQIKGLHKLATELLRLKLKAAGWDGKNSVIEESIALGFHNVFSITQSQLRNWLSAGTVEHDVEAIPEDSDFFFNADDTPPSRDFVFKPGHNAKKTGTVSLSASRKASKAVLLHNAIQNSLYAKLVQQYGEACVGTELDTGAGTAIDIVVKTKSFCWFYEIKTGLSVKACIRQAIPQLLEYAYWNGNDDRADRLVIVALLPITQEAKTYLQFLKKKFRLPIDYQQHTISNRDHAAEPASEYTLEPATSAPILQSPP